MGSGALCCFADKLSCKQKLLAPTSHVNRVEECLGFDEI